MWVILCNWAPNVTWKPKLKTFQIATQKNIPNDIIIYIFMKGCMLFMSELEKYMYISTFDLVVIQIEQC